MKKENRRRHSLVRQQLRDRLMKDYIERKIYEWNKVREESQRLAMAGLGGEIDATKNTG